MTAPPTAPAPQTYDITTIVLHWLVALLVAALWIGAETLDWWPPGPLRGDARSLHILLGSLLGIIGGIRFVWRLSFGTPLPPVDTGLRAVVAKLTHQGMYVLLAAMVFVGMLVLWASGDSAFNMFDLPALSALDHALTAQLRRVHGLIGWVIVAVVSLHVLAVLYHKFVLHDDTLARMRPSRHVG